MAKFLNGAHLNSELVKIFEQAEERLVIISPFIKLHPRIKDSLKEKLNEPKLEITIVFGKNEDNKSKSLNINEFDFFKQFPNIKIKYEPRLHAKYYANESAALLSSMNLYDYSQNNNIEFGILTKPTLLGALAGDVLGDSLDKEAFTYFEKVAANSNILFHNVPVFDQKLMGLTKKYSHSKIKIDEFTKQIGFKNKSRKNRINQNSDIHAKKGFCVRTGDKIPFNLKRPLSDKAFISWNKFKDVNYAEKYCHFSGEKSNGETSFAKPIMKKNWKASQE